MATSVEDLINEALVEIGYTDRIASVFEGSRASIGALEIYGQTRDELFREGDWPLARRANIPLTLWKGPPPAGGYTPATPWTAQYPPGGWLYAYLYPDDMIELKAIMAPPARMPLFEPPPPAVFRIDDDASLIDSAGAAATERKVILCNIKNALAVYTGRVTDPALFEAGFIDMLVSRLGQKLARWLDRGEQVEREELAENQMIAEGTEGDRG